MIRKILSSLYTRNRRALPYLTISSIVLLSFLNIRDDVNEDIMMRIQVTSKKWFFNNRKSLNTSFLGAHLYKTGNLTGERNRTFSILMWRSWQHLQGWQINRKQGSTNKQMDQLMVSNYRRPWTSATPKESQMRCQPFKERGIRKGKRMKLGRYDLLEDCSVKNCIFTANDDKLPTVDAVVVNLQRGDIPKVDHRNPLQRWIFATDNSPYHVFSLAMKRPNLEDFANVFNWSMTYRSDADIPVPYGRTVVLQEPVMKKFNMKTLQDIVPNWDKKIRNVLVAIYISNCNFKLRMNLVAVMQKHIPVDVFGECSTNETNRRRCPGYLSSDCEPISKYLFYLAFENSNCQEYLTEKIWYYAYMKGAIPIIMGPSFIDCKRLLPPNSYIYLRQPVTVQVVQELAAYVNDISKNVESLLSMHQWRVNFKILNEHGLFGTESYHLCRVCQALNYNDDAPKIYSENDLRKFLDPNISCDNKYNL